MIKKIPLASLYFQERFLISRAIAFTNAEYHFKDGSPADFSDTIFVLPTQEAGRLFREKAALFFRDSGGVTSLQTLLPEQLIFNKPSVNHSELQVLKDWYTVLQNADPADFISGIIPQVEYNTDNRIALAKYLSTIRENILLESGMDTADFTAAIADDTNMKLKLDDYAVLEKEYLHLLGSKIDKATAIKNSLADPFKLFSDIKKIILIENSELRNSIKILLERLSSSVEVIHLINTTSENLDDFDEAGCPITEKMLSHNINFIPEKQLRIYSTPITEAQKISSMISVDTMPAAIGVMNNELALSLSHFLAEKNIDTNCPAVRPLNTFYWSKLFNALIDLKKSVISYEDVYNWASDNSFLNCFSLNECGHAIRAELEKLQHKHLIGNFKSLEFFARRYHNDALADENKRESFENAFNFCCAMRKLIDDVRAADDDAMPQSLWDIFKKLGLCADLKYMDISEAENSLEALKNAVVAIQSVKDAVLRSKFFNYELAQTSLPDSTQYKDGAVNFSGFLDLIWYENPTLIIGGISEESFSSSAVEDVFFPESRRRKLGWSSAWGRFGADLHRFETLVKQYSADELFITWSKTTKSGDLNSFPRIFFNSDDETLLKNCHLLFEAKLTEKLPLNATAAPLPDKYSSHLTGKMPEKISVTALKNYIECPYTFYLKNILNCQEMSREIFEFDNAQSGDMLHRVLERYGKHYKASVPDQKELKEFCSAEFEKIFYCDIGFSPNNLALMQNEELRKNLDAFVECEVNMRKSFADHRIIATEQKININLKDLADALPFSDMPQLAAECESVQLVGKIDRIDLYTDADGRKICRIIDYKSSNSSTEKTPQSTHLTTSCPDHLLPKYMTAAQTGNKTKFFADMQLVIYSFFADIMREQLNIPSDAEIISSYYILPLNVESTVVTDFKELDKAMLQNGAKALIHLVNRIFADKHFWPPSLKAEYGTAKKFLNCKNSDDFEFEENKNEQ